MDVELLGDDVPDEVKEVWEHFEVPDYSGKNRTIKEVLATISKGKCMLCKAHVAENASILVDSNGITGLWCGGSCFSDMTISGWLEETLIDVRDKIEFRGRA